MIFNKLYHYFMAECYAWKIRREIYYLRKIGKEKGLPSLDQYSNEAIIEGFRRSQRGTK